MGSESTFHIVFPTKITDENFVCMKDKPILAKSNIKQKNNWM